MKKIQEWPEEFEQKTEQKRIKTTAFQKPSIKIARCRGKKRKTSMLNEINEEI